MEQTRTTGQAFFTQPIRQIVMMLLILGLVAAGVFIGLRIVVGIFLTNPWLNGFILFVFTLGVVSCFWQVFQLVRSVSWIEAFVQAKPGYAAGPAPRLLAPLAALFRTRDVRMQIPPSSARSILDSVDARIDEGSDITRYLANLLIFLGLLGTFYGLATTVPALVETIRALSPEEGETAVDVFGDLMSGLDAQLGGMGTAFSSSLLGLAGSLVVGLLELFAGHGQNRFYRELEEWLSSITRLGYAGAEGEAGQAAPVGVMMDHMGAQIAAMQALYDQTDVDRLMLDERISDLSQAVRSLTDKMEADAAGQATTMARIAEGQERLTAALTGSADGQGQIQVLGRIAEGQERLIHALTAAEGGAHSDAESRMRLRSIDVQLLRILEEISAGRQESVGDLRSDLTALIAAVRQLTRGSAGRD